MRFAVQELVELTQGTLHELWRKESESHRLEQAIEKECSFSIDTRTLLPGQLFIALHGQNTNGHAYLGEALQKGAHGLIISETDQLQDLKHAFLPEHETAPPFILQVGNPLFALEAIARAARHKHPIPVIGITGSNGKTTVKDMTASILATRYHVLKSEKSFNNQIGLPLTIANMSARHEMAVIEMGMNAVGEIRALAAIARPNVGVITNIAPAHIGFFGSLEAIMRAKMELIAALPSSGTAVLNTDDKLFFQMMKDVRCALVTFGMRTSQQRDIHPIVGARNIAAGAEAKYTFDVVTFEGTIHVNLPIAGSHNVSNALAAAAAIYAVHKSESMPLLQIIKQGLEHFQPSPMRMQVITHRNVTIINDAYNANPASMASAFQTLKRLTATGKKIAVLGDMFELGKMSQSAHYDVGKLAAEVPVDKLFLLGNYAEDVAMGAQAMNLPQTNIVIGTSHAEIAQELAHCVQAGDIILCKGSRGMTMEKVLDGFIQYY